MILTIGVAYGVLYNAHYFVLIYYSQVLGLDPGLAGLAVGIGLVFDAITDPLIGTFGNIPRVGAVVEAEHGLLSAGLWNSQCYVKMKGDKKFSQ